MQSEVLSSEDQSALMLLNADSCQLYQSGGYCLMATQPMNGISSMNRIGGLCFDPCEELVWCVTRTGQLTGFYGNTLDPYVTTPVPRLPSDLNPTGNSELRQVLASPRPDERVVYILAHNALHAYSKFGRSLGCTTSSQMQNLECITVSSSSTTVSGSLRDFDSFFCGGLQNSLLELDSRGRWGEIVRTIDVGDAGCVILEPFALGLCAANTRGQVKIIDPRAAVGIVRQIDAHTGEISDLSVMSTGYSLVTCGWSRLTDSSLRIDRLLNVYDLRFGRSQPPISPLVDPSFVSFCSNQPDLLLVASQSGSFQTLTWDTRNLSSESVGNLLLAYDCVDFFALSSNGSCLLFGTGIGNLQLYSSDFHSCHFNDCSVNTIFASPFADSLNPADMTASAAEDADAPAPATGNAALARQTGRKLNRIAEAAASSVDLQVFGSSIHQPLGLLSGVASSPSHLLQLAEHKKLLAVSEALAVAFKPVDFDDDDFSFSSIPFSNHPPVCEPAELSEWVCAETGSRRDGITSDWPPDLCGDRSRKMLPPDPKLIAQANQKGIVGKPSNLGPVWFPYEPPTFSTDLTDFAPDSLCPKQEKYVSYVDKMINAAC